MLPQKAPSDVKARLKASYDAMAPTYNTWTERHTYLRMAYLDDLCARAPKLTASDQTSAIVELGCGSGTPFLDTLLTRGAGITATANDLSDTMMDLARTKLAGHGSRVHFEAGDMTMLSFETGSLTAVVALYSLVHLPRDEQSAMLQKIATWLEPGGYLLANFAVEETNGIVNEQWLNDKGWMFWSGLGLEQTVADLERGGMMVEKKEVEGDDEEKLLWIIAKR